ncbi:MAG: shikimate kinase [Clostridia bacterium]|nr:shikimate kinase [Clostridia bacterium]
MTNIVLIGMPGSGKTSIGKELAKLLDFNFFDCDQAIEELLCKSVLEIFEDRGEEFFRKMETDTLKFLLLKTNSVISTGGGVVEKSENIDILKKCGTVVFINRPLENIMDDINTSHRPLLKDGKDRLVTLFERRFDLYQKTCDIEIENKGSIQDVARKIIDEVKKNG